MPVKGRRQIYKPWVKLHIRMLHNHEIAQLPDSSYRRFTECLLFAGEERNKAIEEKREVIEGLLPDIGYMAWTLHVTVSALTDDLSRLALAGLVELHDSGRWFVTNFAKWQAPSTDAERQKTYRERTRNQDKEKEERERVIDSVTVVTKQSQNVTGRTPTQEPAIYSQAHSAVRAMQEVTTYWPGEVTHPIIIEKLGDAPDVRTLGRAYQLWMTNGNNPRNYAGICDWYNELRRDSTWTPQARFKNGHQVQVATPDEENIWTRAIAAIKTGKLPQDDMLAKAIKAVGWSRLQEANQYNERQVKEALIHEYRNAATA